MNVSPILSKDDYNIFEFVERKNNNNYFRAVCSKCGHTKIIGANNLKRQSLFCSYMNCKEDYLLSLVGNVSGDYQFVEVRGEKIIAKCLKCGHTKSLHAHEMRTASFAHNGASCGKDYSLSFIGKTFGDFEIVAIDQEGERVTKEVYYVAKCKICGVETKASLKSLSKNAKHGMTCFKAIPDNKYKQIFEQRFNDMKQRCYNPNHTNYEHYGARGIQVEYEHLVDFYLDFIEEFKEFAAINGVENTTFDRINVNGNYSKDNLRLATQSIQSTNTTRRKLFIIQKDARRILGDNAMEVARIIGINGRSLGNLIRGSSKSAGGWTLVGVYQDNIDVQHLINDKDVTTNLITSM